MDLNNLPGSLKVAVLLKAVEKKTQDKILHMMSEEEKKLIQSNLSQLNDISPDVIEKVSKEFALNFDATGTNPKSSDGNQRGQKGPSDQKKDEKLVKKLNAIRSIDPEKLFGVINKEHPQTIAVILSHLKPEIASKILAMLPDEDRSEVAVRIVKLDKVMANWMEEIDQVFEDILTNVEDDKVYKTGGIGNLAEILNQSNEETVKLILEAIEDVDEELVVKIKQSMFVFDDLVYVDDRGMQMVLRKVDTKELAVALKAATDEVKEKVFSNMSGRAGKILEEEIESLRAIKIKEVEKAQQKIADIIQKMESAGELAIIRGGGGDFV